MRSSASTLSSASPEGRRSVGCKDRARRAGAARRRSAGLRHAVRRHGLWRRRAGTPVPLSILQQPKIEAEVAFVFGRDLAMERPGLVDVMHAIEYALPALEIVGSRIANWNTKFVDIVADNASSGAGGSTSQLDRAGPRQRDDARRCAGQSTRVLQLPLTAANSCPLICSVQAQLD
jgi:hypothetical protein